MENQTTPKSSNFYVASGAGFSSLDHTWTTPKDLFVKLNAEFTFTLDAAAVKETALLPNYLGPDHEVEEMRNALTADWQKASGGGAVFLNPPYGRTLKLWLAKADSEAKKGITVACLVPSRTDTAWWWDSCMHHEIRFFRGRLKFGNSGGSAPFPSALVVMK